MILTCLSSIACISGRFVTVLANYLHYHQHNGERVCFCEFPRIGARKLRTLRLIPLPDMKGWRPPDRWGGWAFPVPTVFAPPGHGWPRAGAISPRLWSPARPPLHGAISPRRRFPNSRLAHCRPLSRRNFGVSPGGIKPVAQRGEAQPKSIHHRVHRDHGDRTLGAIFSVASVPSVVNFIACATRTIPG